jgi:hypothetical protein
MRWIADCNSENLSLLTEYLDFNRMSYEKRDLWQCTAQADRRYDVPDDLLECQDTVLILSSGIFELMLQWPRCWDRIRQYLQHNRMLVWANYDSFDIINRCQGWLQKLDASIPPQQCWIWVDARPTQHNWMQRLQHISILPWELNRWCRMLRIEGTRLDKHAQSRDFMLTMIIKRTRPHRAALWTELQSRPGLLDRGWVSAKHRRSTWLGLQPHWDDGREWYPSMDLYRHSWLEVVPETFYRHGYFLTEKTIKPMVTKTPFLMVANQHYLKFLHSLGFKTFGDIIDESYDDYFHLQDRVRAMVDQLESIVAQGAQRFYQQALPVLEHNYRHMQIIEGGWQHRVDHMFGAVISQVDQKFNSLYNMDIIEEQT